MGILLCLTGCLRPQDCNAMHPWTSLEPAGPGALQGSWWFDPALPISTVFATTLQVREHVEGRPSSGRWHRMGRACDLLEVEEIIIIIMTIPISFVGPATIYQRPALLCRALCSSG